MTVTRCLHRWMADLVDSIQSSPLLKRTGHARLFSFFSCLLLLSALFGSSIFLTSQDVHASSLPSPWSDGDIGTVGVAGSASYSNGNFTVNGSGIVEYTYDKFHYLYQPLYGDGTIVAHVTGLTGGTNNAKAGVMIRSDLNGWPPAVNSFLELNASGTITFQRRLTAGGDTSYTSLSDTYASPYWLKLVRAGNTITASASADGNNWSQVGSDILDNLAVDAWVGLAVTSGNDSDTSTATFDHVSITQPTVNTRVDWSNAQGTISPLAYGTNGFSALDPSVLSDASYTNAITSMNAGSIRLHYAGLLNDSSTDSRGWVNTSAKTWDATHIKTILDGVDSWKSKGYQPAVLINIPGFPGWLSTYQITDPNNGNATVTSGLLASNQFDAYAAFCAQLVQIVNIDQHRGVKYFELPNETDQAYNQNIADYNKAHSTSFPDKMAELATLYNKAVVAMKNVDPSIQVGGPALERPDTIAGVKNFITNTVNQSNPTTLDFLSIHGYASGSASDSDAYIYNRIYNPVSNQGSLNDVVAVRQALDAASGSKHIPLWFDEYNISWTYETHDVRMTNYKGVVYDALAMNYFLRNGTDVLQSWNDADGIYGKIDPNSSPTTYQLRPGGQFLQLMNTYGIGSRVATTTDTENTIVPFAVKTAHGYTYMLINRSSNPRQVTSSFTGGASTSDSFTQNQFSAAGLTTSTVNNIGTLNLPAFSVTLLTENGNGGQSSLFSTGLEGSDIQPTWSNTIDTNFPGGNISNVNGICCGLTGPEAGTRNEVAHTGSAALMYSGLDNSSNGSYAYDKVFDVSSKNIKVGASTKLSYWIYPQSSNANNLARGKNSTCVALDLIFTDGTSLRDSGAVDQHGKRLHPAYQCNTLTLDSWNNVLSNIGDNVAGKTISRINIGYDQPLNTGGYRGYIDDISLSN
ncbi:hypothetical protein KDA_48340 [Dictyobacter alpinus]|uniref:Glycosyl hydrolases family 39 N-terminal catalytic domain-containing protein n=1 Tax=Dictyobacter alpinus TaxID=2014873 RepID=A0A402BDG6_9CHLR|nr:DUF1349 domain-containing protein [Dictyobacter alpinus]GCE29350.1 hypothetical protein KDA_48340 [Dictyobacter alpinus]